VCSITPLKDNFFEACERLLISVLLLTQECLRLILPEFHFQFMLLRHNPKRMRTFKNVIRQVREIIKESLLATRYVCLYV
jgi:hypothetical protein